jgi:hypothetical protein
MIDPNITEAVNTLVDGTKVLTTYRAVTTPQGTKQVQVAALTLDQLQTQLTEVQAKIALLTAAVQAASPPTPSS